MTLFYILVLIMLSGAVAIAWILIAEKKKESPAPLTPKPTAPQVSPKEVLGRLGLEDNKTLEKKTAPIAQQPTAITEAAQAQSELSLKYDELLTNHTELKAKYAKVETLFAEKSVNLEKSEKALNNELKNQKEFNKLKDILEKEIKDSKDKISTLQSDLRNAQTESQTQLKRVSQLEEKVKKLEKDVLTSETAIHDAQALTQAARKHSSELEEKLKATENQILEKNLKIEDLVNRLKDLPPASPMPAAKPANVDEQGGAQKEQTPSSLALKTNGEDTAIEEKPTLQSIVGPEALPVLEQKPSGHSVIEKPADGSLTLPADILEKHEQKKDS